MCLDFFFAMKNTRNILKSDISARTYKLIRIQSNHYDILEYMS